MLKGLSNKFPQITVVERKISDKGPSFGEQFHTDSSYTKRFVCPSFNSNFALHNNYSVKTQFVETNN